MADDEIARDARTTDETASGMSQRERRRSRQGVGSERRQLAWRHYRAHLVILLVFGGIVTTMVVAARGAESCPGHWHSTVDVFVDGKRVSYAHPKFTLEGSAANGGSMSGGSHMHQGEDWMWHFEAVAGTTCTELGKALRSVDTELSPGRLVLDGGHEDLNQAGTYVANDTATLRAWHRSGSGDWQTIGINALAHRQLKGDERVIVVYGNDTDEGIAAFQAKAEANSMQGSTPERGPSYVAATGVAIMGLIVLGAWHALSRKAT